MKKTNKNLVNHFLLIVDESGSMISLRSKAIKIVNERIEKIRIESLNKGQTSYISLMKFSSDNKMLEFCVDSDNMRNINSLDYKPDNGLTALMDATGDGINRLTLLDNGNPSFVVMVITDGLENNSKRFNKTSLNQLIKEKQATDRWTFTFEVPRGQKNSLHSSLGVPLDNINEWDVSEEGFGETQICTQNALTSYFGSRAMGQSSTQNFYVATDLSNVTRQDLQDNLDDLAGQFRIMPVQKECQIRDLVESHGVA